LFLIVAMCVATVLFLCPFVVYPAVMLCTKRRLNKADVAFNDTGLNYDDLPTVALVICALNEQKVIGAKMENCLALQYPREKLRIIVISDGSTDGTVDIIRCYEGRGIELIDNTVRRGKIANLNEVLPACEQDILMLSDANVLYKADAVLRIVSRFKDPSVGCVSGKVILTDNTPDLDGPTGQYYSIEWMLQECSSQVYSMVGADGAMYAMRRELFRPCPNDTLIEDLIIPMQVIRQGRRVVFEGNAIGWEPGVTSLAEEFRRKIRIAAGAAQAIRRGNVWPGNAPLKFWCIFIAHKLLRWLSPVMGLVLLLLCCMSLQEPLSLVLISAFATVSVLAAARLVAGYNHPLVSGAFYFLFAQVAIAIGLFKGLRGRQSVLWAKADR
jgi:cellulose synthase/poly-beta-1,6-N-acetylglucosamine synthase-like glycosyltransferase